MNVQWIHVILYNEEQNYFVQIHSMLKSFLLALIWLQTPSTGLAWTWWVAACITAQTNVIFITNRIFPIQYWEQTAVVVVLRDNKLSYFLSADRWFLGVNLSKEKVLLKKIIVIHIWGLKLPRKSKRYILVTCKILTMHTDILQTCGWNASHIKVMILWKAQTLRFAGGLQYSSHKMICVFTCKKKTCSWTAKPYESMAPLPAVIFMKCILSWYGNRSHINYLWFPVFKILKMTASVRHIPPSSCPEKSKQKY